MNFTLPHFYLWRIIMILATISGAFNNELISEIINHPMIGGFRFNTGVPIIHTPYETLAKLRIMTSKPIWIDLKCRQLRIAKWAVPYYGEIELNHEIEIEFPAQIHFRGVGWTDIRAVKGNKIYLVNPPEQAVGQGQSVNIRARFLKVKGYFTEEDIAYIKAAESLGINHFMLSFYEGEDDLERLMKQLKNTEDVCVGLKIESIKGVEAVESIVQELAKINLLLFDKKLTLVVARDDLLINLGDNAVQIVEIIKQCLEYDQNAIVASQFFSGIEHTGVISAADISDISLLNKIGYKDFMLSDEICLRHFHQVMEILEQYFESK